MSDATSMPIPSVLWDKLSSLTMPSQTEFVDQLSSMGALPAAVLIGCGVGSLFWGWKIFKYVVVGNAACVGATAGAQLGSMAHGENMPLFGAIGGGLLLGSLSWPLIKPATAIMSALAGGLMGYGAWHSVASALNRDDVAGYAWAGGVIGVIALGLLALVLSKTVVKVLTSFQGAMMGVSGAIALCLRYEPTSNGLKSALVNNAPLFALLILVPTVVGFASQYNTTAKKEKKKKKATEGD